MTAGKDGGEPQERPPSGLRIALAGASGPFAGLLGEAVPGAGITSLAEGDDPQSPLPDLVLLAADAAPETLSRAVARHARAATAGARLPLAVLADATRDPLAGLFPLRPDAVLAPELPPARLAERIAAIVRDSVRLEEACLRQATLGHARPDRLRPDRNDPSPVSRPPAGGTSRVRVLVFGDSSALARAAARRGLPLAPVGALRPEAALALLERDPLDADAPSPVEAMLLDAPASHVREMLEALARDPRHLHLPSLAVTRGTDAALAALTDGATDAVSARATPEAIAARLAVLLGARARRRLADRRLERFRRAIHDGAPPLPRPLYEAYRAGLARALATRGRAPLEIALEAIHAGPRELESANDGIFPPPARNPVLTTTLAASREEDFVARVMGLGDVALLRDMGALTALRRRIAAIVDRTSFS